jgi:hypothetical protein
MKTIKIVLRETGVNQYTVEKYSNTAQLSTGMVVDRARLESWAGMARVDFTVLAPVQSEEEETLAIDLADGKQVSTGETNFDPESGQTFVDARAFDTLACELSGIHQWSTDSVLALASQPDAGNANLGSAGITGKIERSNAIALMRKNAAKATGLSVDEVSHVAYRAQMLPVLKKYAENMAVQPF